MKTLTALLLIPVLVDAEPGPVTRQLMSEPASLFDIGMMRLERLASWAEGHVGGAWTLGGKLEPITQAIYANYDPEEDKIIVTVFSMDESATEDQMEEGCREALWQLQIVVSKSLPGIFQHAGPSDPEKASDLRQALVEMFELRCYVSGNDSSHGRFWAHKTLGAEEMTVGRWETRP